MKLIFLLILVSLYVYYAYAKAVYTIGGLFHDDNYESEMAFRYAVYRYNMYNTDIHFKSNIQHVSKTDTFTVSKLLCNMTSTSEGLVAIFGPESPTTTSMVQSICSNLEIPHIQTNWRPSSSSLQTPNPSTILNMHPDPDSLALGLATLLRHMEWSSYAILYQRKEGLMRLQEVLKVATVDDAPVVVRQLGEDLDHRSLLKEIRNSSYTNIILDCDNDRIIDILKQAHEVNLLDFFYSYLITSLDAHTLDFAELNTRANITLIRIVDPDSSILNNAVRDWEYGEMNNNRAINILPNKVKTETVLMYDAVNFFTLIFPELHATQPFEARQVYCDSGLKDKWKEGFRITEYMKVRPITNTITGPVKFNDFGRRIDFTMQIAEVISGRCEKTATWSPENPSTLNFTRSASEQMQQIVENLQKTTVIVSSRIGPPYLRDVIAAEGQTLEGNDRYEGFSKDLIYLISKELNFSFKIELAEDGNYGNYDPKTKSWNGLIKDLLTRKAHLAICDLTITHQRRSAVDFSLPFMTLGISILYSKAKKEDTNQFAFLDPFGVEVWVYTGSLYLGVSIMLYFIARMAPGDWENPHPCDQNPEELENIWDLKNCLWLTLGSFMQQGCDILPKGISSRMGASMWWFFSLILISSYTANLAAFLTMNRMSSPIDGAEALVKQTKIKYGTVIGGATQSFFQESNFSTYARMWTNMVSARPSVFESNNGDGVKRVLTTKNQGYAFLMESSSIEYEVRKNCNLKQIGGRLDSKGYGIAMPMNSPYRSAINKAVLKLQEEGKLNDLKTRWWKEKVDVEIPCDASDSMVDGADLALDNVGGVFIVLGLGTAIAFLLALLEFFWNVRKVAIEEHLTFFEALIVELKFAMKVWVTQKRVKPILSESSSSKSARSREGSETRSIAQKVMHGATSFLDIFDRSNSLSKSNNKN